VFSVELRRSKQALIREIHSYLIERNWLSID
jgi:hypothetical protein